MARVSPVVTLLCFCSIASLIVADETHFRGYEQQQHEFYQPEKFGFDQSLSYSGSSGSGSGSGSVPSVPSVPSYDPTPSGGSGSVPSVPSGGGVPSGGIPSGGIPSGGVPSSGGAYGGSSDPTPDPSYGSGSGSGSVPSVDPSGGGGIPSVPSGGIGGIPSVPSGGGFPTVPSTGGTSPTTSGCSCDFWAAHVNSWPDPLQLISTVSAIFGGLAGNAFGPSTTLLSALQNTRRDPYSQLLRQGTAAMLNAYSRPHFQYTPQAVRYHLNAALVSPQAAASQAAKFANANRGYGTSTFCT